MLSKRESNRFPVSTLGRDANSVHQRGLIRQDGVHCPAVDLELRIAQPLDAGFDLARNSARNRCNVHPVTGWQRLRIKQQNLAELAAAR
jgi:hypothetical protein